MSAYKIQTPGTYPEESIQIHTVTYIYVQYVNFAKVWPSDKSDLEILADSIDVLNFKYSG
jgi:hypothetical protein